jgi:hypothetical protein
MRHAPPSVVEPAPMEGAGVYNRNSRVQASGLRPALPLLERAAQAAALPAGTAPVVIADYGSAAGHNSMLPMSTAIAVLRRRAGDDRPISIVHTDVPGNDFSGLFQALQNDPDSYRHATTGVYSSAVGQSFYEQILPSQSVSIGWSSWAVQWLSRTPATIPDQVQVSFSKDAAARAAYARQADEDWRAFLSHRDQELRPGGQLVVITMALSDDGKFGYEPLLAAIYGGLLNLVGEGFIGEAEVERMVIPTVGRRRVDFLAPFDKSGRFGSLKVETAEVFFGEDGIWAEYEQARDAGAFGARWAAFSRASVFQTLSFGLEEGHADPRAGEFVTKLERHVAEKLAERPERMVLPLARLAFSRAER